MNKGGIRYIRYHETSADIVKYRDTDVHNALDTINTKAQIVTSYVGTTLHIVILDKNIMFDKGCISIQSNSNGMFTFCLVNFDKNSASVFNLGNWGIELIDTSRISESGGGIRIRLRVNLHSVMLVSSVYPFETAVTQ